MVLPVAIAALYWKHLKGAWRSIFVVTMVFALYLNVFVLVAQLFQKVPAMIALAPTQTAPAFVVTHFIVIALFVVLGGAAVKGFRTERAAIAG